MSGTLTVRLPEKVRAELRRISKIEHTPLSDLVRESIRQYVTLYQFRKLRNKTLPFAEAEGLLTDEDVFKAIS